MKLIPLTQGQFAMVPDDNFDELNKHKWCAQWVARTQTFYAIRNGPRIKGEPRKRIYMHRVILNAPEGTFVDHVDHNGLHNVPPNIRIDSFKKNNQNRRIQKNNTSGFKGVHWVKSDRVWRVVIYCDKKMIRIGRFHYILDAARAYNEAALKYHGEFARLNDILEDLMCCC